MSRKLRFVPGRGSLVEVTCRTIQGRFLLCPSPQLNDIVLGILGRAQRLYPVEIVGYSFLSSHYHLLLWVETPQQMSKFMCYLNGNLAREVGRLTRWTDKLWSRRYDHALVTDEEESQVKRLSYVLSNCVKENLVAKVEEWPGVHCGPALLTGDSVEGTWYDRTLAYNARLRRKTLEPGELEKRETVVLSQLPCWKHLSSEAYRARVAELVRGIEEAAAVEREKKGTQPLGAEEVQAQSPETRPESLDRSPAPFIHAATKKARKLIHEAYAYFYAAYREAAEKLKQGDLTAAFPPGSFPPHLPFVPT
jgi:REP element-mobilizing transposase RayT